MFLIETDRLKLYEFNESHAEYIFRLNHDPDVMRYTGDVYFESIEHALEKIKAYNHYRVYGYGRWLCEVKETREIIGWCGLKWEKEDGEEFVDLGYRFFKEYWGKGYATESAFASLNYGFEKLGMTNILARVLQENKASIHVMKKLGMTFVKSAVCHDLKAELHGIRREEFDEFVSSGKAPCSVSFE